MQAQVNELVIETLSDGVLVVDARGQRARRQPGRAALLGCGDARLAPPFARCAASRPGSRWRTLARLHLHRSAAAQRAELAIDAAPARSRGACRCAPA